MDWSKAKNILIIAFTITNLVLISVLVNNILHDNKTIKDDHNFIENVKNELEKKDIKVDTEIPTRIPNMALLTLKYETYETNNLIDVFMKDEVYDTIKSGNKIYIKNPNRVLTITNKNKIVYGDLNKEKIYNNLKLKQLENIIEKFLSENGFEKDYKLVSYTIEDDTHVLLYKPVFKGIIIENDEAVMKFKVDNTGIKIFERIWTESIRLKQIEMEVVSAADTLLKLLSHPDSFGKTITKIDLCYYFDGDSIRTKEGDAAPAWKIDFSDGTYKILK